MPLRQFPSNTNICNRHQNMVLRVMGEAAYPGYQLSWDLTYELDNEIHFVQFACLQSSNRTTEFICEMLRNDMSITPESTMWDHCSTTGSGSEESFIGSGDGKTDRDAIRMRKNRDTTTDHSINHIDHHSQHLRRAGGRKDNYE